MNAGAKRMNAGVIKIEDVYSFRLGITQRNGLKQYEKGEPYFFIQPKDIVDGEIQKPDLFYAEPRAMKRHLLRKGDLLLVNKGVNYAAAIYDGKFPNSVASSSFFIIEGNDTVSLTAYLKLYLQQDEVKDYLKNNSATTTVHSLNKATLGALQIPLLSIEKQEELIQIAHSINEQNKIMQSIISKNIEYLNSYLWESISTYEKK